MTTPVSNSISRKKIRRNRFKARLLLLVGCIWPLWVLLASSSFGASVPRQNSNSITDHDNNNILDAPSIPLSKNRLNSQRRVLATDLITSKAKSNTIEIGHFLLEGGDGSSIEQAVVIKNAKNDFDGIEAEALWIRKCTPAGPQKAKRYW